MKNRAPVFFHGLLILLIPVFGAGEANADQPDHERIHESYVLTPGASVEVSGIAGPVEIETGRGDTADVTVTRSAPTHAELQCGRVAIEQTPRGLRIRSETLCPVDHADERHARAAALGRLEPRVHRGRRPNRSDRRHGAAQ